MKNNNLKIFSGNSSLPLSREIARCLNVSLGLATVERFQNDEIRVKIEENVRGYDVFLVQSTSYPVNDHLMELLIMLDALRRASAQRITAVIPYYGYARQDRKATGREPISAKLVANLITTAGADRILAVDLHAGQIQGFFDIPVDHLEAIRIFSSYFKKKKLKNIVVVSPDVGGVARARILAENLRTPIAIITKRRPYPDVSEVEEVVGDVSGQTAIMLDDMVLTGGSLVHGAEALIARGARHVFACATHGILCGDATQKISNSQIEELVITNTVKIDEKKINKKIKILSIAPLLAEAIERINKGKSVSELFNT